MNWKEAMNNPKKLAIVLALLVFAIGVGVYVATPTPGVEKQSPVTSKWSETSSTGKLTQEMSYFAVSARTSPVLRMSYPYNQLTASIGFGCDRAEQWMYVAFSEPPNIANAQTEEELHRFVSKIRFDGKTQEFEATQAFGSRFVHFKDDTLILMTLLKSSSMSFEVDWHREGFVNFEFPLAGSAQMIDNARTKCSSI